MTVTDKIETTDAICEYLMLPWRELRAPLARLHAAAVHLGSSPHADLLRMDACHRIRLGQDHVFSLTRDPVVPYAEMITAVATYLEAAALLAVASSSVPDEPPDATKTDITGRHYGHLWGDFSPEHYFDEATTLLRTRLERNGFDLTNAAKLRVLDAGCGGGRYSVALRRLGFGEVVGVDWSPLGIATANARAKESNVTGVTYQIADVLALPFADHEFDVVFSNGVLHHTQDTERGVGEIARTVKPGGRVWLYLYARPGGLDRLTPYLAHLLLRTSNREVCRRYCHSLGLSGNRTFFLLDMWMTPIAECYSPDEMDAMLRHAGFRKWRRATRGTDYDSAERIYQNDAFAATKYGVGENRYLIDA